MAIIYSDSVLQKYTPSYSMLDGTFAVAFPSPMTLLASQLPQFGTDTIWQAGSLRFREAAFGAEDHHVTTARGVKLYVEPGEDGSYNFLAFGADNRGGGDIKILMETVLGKLPAGSTLKLPAGRYAKGGTGGGKHIALPAGTRLIGEPGATIVSSSYPVFRTSDDTVIEGLTFDNSTGGISIGIEVEGVDVAIRRNTFYRGNQQVYLRDCERVDIEDNTFKETGYAVLQKSGYTSNAVRVSRNRFLRCTGDCVELNSETANPCWGWQILDNYAKDIGGTERTEVATEDRFFGATATRGVVISGNLIDGIAGDSALHFESLSGDTLVTGNVFRDLHGDSGKLIFLTGSLQDCTIDFSHNHVEFSSEYAFLEGETATLIYQLGGDSALLRLIDNTFVNRSIETMAIHSISNSKRGSDFVGNRVQGFDTVIKAGTGSTTNQVIRMLRNSIDQATCAVRLSASNKSTAYYVCIDENTFTDCLKVWEAEVSGVTPQSLTNNICQGTTLIDEASIIGLAVASHKVLGNDLRDGAHSTRAIGQNYIANSGDKELFRLTQAPGGYPSLIINVRTTDGSSSSGNATFQTVLLQRVSAISTRLITLNSETSGSGASFTLSMSGNSLMGRATSNRWVEVSLPGPLFASHTPSLT